MRRNIQIFQKQIVYKYSAVMCGKLAKEQFCFEIFKYFSVELSIGSTLVQHWTNDHDTVWVKINDVLFVSNVRLYVSPRGRPNIKIQSDMYRNPHYLNKTVSWPSYICNENTILEKTVLYKNGVLSLCSYFNPAFPIYDLSTIRCPKLTAFPISCNIHLYTCTPLFKIISHIFYFLKKG